MRHEKSQQRSKGNPTVQIEGLEARRMMSAVAGAGRRLMETQSVGEGIYGSAIKFPTPNKADIASPHFVGAAPSMTKKSANMAAVFSDTLIPRPAVKNILVAAMAEGNAASSNAVVGSNAPNQAGRALGVSSAHSFAGRPPRREQNRGISNSRGRVLVVEDDAGTRRALSAILQKQGWDVSTAATVADGIRLLATRPDHVIVDLMLPDGDGARILEHANASSLYPHVTVTTGVADFEHLERVRQLGAEAVFIKPVNLPDLLKQLSN